MTYIVPGWLVRKLGEKMRCPECRMLGGHKMDCSVGRKQ